MKKILTLLLPMALLFACTPQTSPPEPSPSPSPTTEPSPREDVMYTMPYKEYGGAFMNPLKGFRANSRGDHLLLKNYETLVHVYLAWDEIEESAADGADKILAVCEEKWKGLEYTSCKVIPRVYLDYPSTTYDPDKVKMTAYGTTYYVERRWPDDMEVGDYSSPQFIERLQNLIGKLGEALDDHPLVAYVEMGIIGFWGEQHMPDLTAEMQTIMGDAFTAAFKNKKVMVRRADNFLDYAFGMYWDSFNHTDEEYQKTALLARGGLWKTQVIGGETAYDWGRYKTQPGDDPNDTLSDPLHRDSLIDTIREVHANHLGWVADYTGGLPEVRAGAVEVQKALGYRFVIEEASYSEVLNGEMKVSLEVVNTGSSPFYYDWPIQFSLLMDGKVKYKYTLRDFPLSSVMPGEDWNLETRRYDTAPERYTVDAQFAVSGLEDGDYMLCVSVPEPTGGIPGLRFANENYTVFCMTPLGWVGVGKPPDRHGLDGYTFASFEEDDLFFRPR